MKTNNLICLVSFLAFTSFTFAQSLYPGQQSEKLSISSQVPIKAYSFNLSDVRWEQITWMNE